MTQFSSDILFEKFLDYFELYFKSRENLIRQINNAKLDDKEMSEEEFDFKFGDAQNEVGQYRDLAKSALDSYIKEYLGTLDA